MSGHYSKSGPDEEQGQATLEFALVVMFLLLVVFGIVDFSRVFFGYATMSNGVREGARYAVVHPNDDAGIEQAARAMMVVIGAPVEVTISFPDEDKDSQPGCRSSRCRVVVTATSDFSVWTPIIPNFQMQASATMHIE
jgi:Flp pilus assembly protein TadG